MDKTISIGIATCIISVAGGAFIPTALSLGMITQTNAIYYFIGLGVLLLMGIGFLIYGIRLKPKSIPSMPTANPQNTKSSNHKLVHSIICEISGIGLIVGGALLAINSEPLSNPGFLSFMMVLIGFVIFIMGFAAGVGK